MLQDFCNKLATHTVYKADQWLKAMESASFFADAASLNESQCKQLAESCPSPEHYIHIIKLLERYAWTSQETSGGWHLLLEYVDDSDFCLRDWVEALVSFSEWVEASDGAADLKTMLGYLHCCCISSQGECQLPLTHVLHEMLNQYGFSGGHKVSKEN